MSNNTSATVVLTNEEREVLNEGLEARKEKRDTLIGVITTNANNKFTKEYLEKQTTETLSNIASLATPKDGNLAINGQGRFFGMAGGAFAPPPSIITNAAERAKILGEPLVAPKAISEKLEKK